jgi:hypothetical protein
MKIASISVLQKELKERSPHEIVDICMRVAKYKKENKELLNYLLFESIDEENFKEILKNEIEGEFAEINLSSVYFAKKSIRRILRIATKHIKYSGSKQTEVELLIFFCQEMRKLKLPFHESKVLINLYKRQLINIQKSMGTLNEDLQFDYYSDVEEISKPLSRLYY